MQHTYSFAGHTVEINSIYDEVHRLCADYRTASDAEYHIKIKSSDIAYEREKSSREDILNDNAVRVHAEPYLETLAVYRRLAELFVRDDILLMHGAVVAVDDDAYMFTAKSGTGKTTHIRLWLKEFGDRISVVNGDKPLIHIGTDNATVYGTPWDGKEHLSSSISCKLKAICILTRSDANSIERISKKEALPMLCQQSYKSEDPMVLAEILALVNRLGNMVPLYRLGCNTDSEAAIIAYNGMK